MNKIKVGIVGGAGYTGGELLRLLVFHPEVEIVFVHSKSNAGNLVSDVHPDLSGTITLRFTDVLSDNIDVLFLCVGHGDASKFLAENQINSDIKMIDLSQDFRKSGAGNNFIYGLPELQREKIKTAQNVANPGCFATCIQLALLPLAADGHLLNDLHVSAITGSTGAGQSLTETSHFSWRNNNISIYKPFAHQHLNEIKQSLTILQPSFSKDIHFIPFRGDFTRGIFATVYLKSDLAASQANALYQDYYASHPFTRVAQKNPALKQVVNTNNAIVYLEKHDDQLLIVSMIDNLLKGASGQAVQNMNLMFQLQEVTGLNLKANAF